MSTLLEHIFLLLLIHFCCYHSSYAYRVGDAIDTILQTPAGVSDAMLDQMPRFGISTQAIFHNVVVQPQQQQQQSSFSLAFEEGFRQLPWVTLDQKNGRTLEKLIVTFVYSKSSGGSIHSVSSQTLYTSSATTNQQQQEAVDVHNNGSFRADYIWIEEEAVDLNTGASVMFLATLVATFVMLIHACGVVTGDLSNDGLAVAASSSGVAVADHGGGSYMGGITSSSSEPKWE